MYALYKCEPSQSGEQSDVVVGIATFVDGGAVEHLAELRELRIKPWSHHTQAVFMAFLSRFAGLAFPRDAARLAERLFHQRLACCKGFLEGHARELVILDPSGASSFGRKLGVQGHRISRPRDLAQEIFVVTQPLGNIFPAGCLCQKRRVVQGIDLGCQDACT